MPKKVAIDPQFQPGKDANAWAGVHISQIADAIQTSRAQRDEDLGLTKDGRKRWRRKPKALVEYDRLEILAALRLQGKDWEEIAGIVNLPVNQLKSLASSDRYKRFYADLLANFKEEQQSLLRYLVPQALKTLGDLLSAKSEHVRYEAAQAILANSDVLREQARETEDTDLHSVIEQLRKKAAKTDVQINVGVALNASPPALEPAITVLPVELMSASEPAGTSR